MQARQAYLFDLDGTLCHTEPLHFTALRRIVEGRRRTLDRQTFETQLAGQTTHTVMARLFPGLPEAERNTLVEAKEKLFREFARGLMPVAGVADFIDAVADTGAHIGLVTNAPRMDADYILRLLRLDHRFGVKVIASELSDPKPHPMAYLQALTECGVKADNAIVFEDSIAGVKSATAAGIRTVGVTTTLSREDLTAIGAFMTIPDFRGVTPRDVMPCASQRLA